MVYDSKGDALADPDYTQGRLLEVGGRLTFYTWDELPQGTDIAAELGELPASDEPSAMEQLRAQVDYTAVLTDTVLSTGTEA